MSTPTITVQLTPIQLEALDTLVEYGVDHFRNLDGELDDASPGDLELIEEADRWISAATTIANANKGFYE